MVQSFVLRQSNSTSKWFGGSERERADFCRKANSESCHQRRKQTRERLHDLETAVQHPDNARMDILNKLGSVAHQVFHKCCVVLRWRVQDWKLTFNASRQCQNHYRHQQSHLQFRKGDIPNAPTAHGDQKIGCSRCRASFPGHGLKDSQNNPS